MKNIKKLKKEFEEHFEKGKRMKNGRNIVFTDIQSEIERAKWTLGALYALDELDINIGVYDKETRELKLVSDPDKEMPRLRIGIYEVNKIIVMGLFIRVNEDTLIPVEEKEKRIMEHNKNKLVT